MPEQGQSVARRKRAISRVYGFSLLPRGPAAFCEAKAAKKPESVKEVPVLGKHGKPGSRQGRRVESRRRQCDRCRRPDPIPREDMDPSGEAQGKLLHLANAVLVTIKKVRGTL